MSTPELERFVDAIRVDLIGGGRHKIPGFGTFSRCTRKAAPGRPECTIAMFRADPVLRAHVAGSAPPELAGAHALAVARLITGMQEDDGIVVPGLGRLAVIHKRGKKPRLIFHAAAELNESLG